MTDEEYTEPTNAQLARFLVQYRHMIPGAENLQLSPPVLEALMSENPKFRAGALRHHRQFQEWINEHSNKLQEGKLQCEHILNSGKRCPNHNQPGSAWCGLHKEIHEEGAEDDS